MKFRKAKKCDRNKYEYSAIVAKSTIKIVISNRQKNILKIVNQTFSDSCILSKVTLNTSYSSLCNSVRHHVKKCSEPFTDHDKVIEGGNLMAI
jgi:hypothetical protein